MKLISSPKLYYLGNSRVEIHTTRIHRILIKLHLIDFKKYYNRQCPSLNYLYDFENTLTNQRVYTLRTYNISNDPGPFYAHLGVFSSKKAAERYLVKYSHKLAIEDAKKSYPRHCIYDHAVINETLVDSPDDTSVSQKHWFYRYRLDSAHGIAGHLEPLN
jgi:hypothetical protein